MTADTLLPLNDLKIPMYWVSGNHERYAGIGPVMKILKSSPLITLQNETADFMHLQIIGINDSDNRKQVEMKLKEIEFDPRRYTVLLYHQPEGFAAASKAGVNLMLSGHTHNGQIFPFNIFVKIRFKYIRGLYSLNGSFLYVSTGTGTWGPAMRLASRNQITIIKMRKPK